MKISRVHSVWFSATGNTRQIVARLSGFLAGALGASLETIDVTAPAARNRDYQFQPDELAVFGFPTYAGKLPNKLLPYIRSGFAGNGAPAIAIVTFGNRGFDNSLAELCACLNGDGFHTIAAGAFAARHAFSEILAAGRPDERDFETLTAFGAAVRDRLLHTDGILPTVSVPGSADAPYYTPLGLDGRPAVFLKAKPKTDPSRCNNCGECARLCPMGSIRADNVGEVPGVCVKCHRCIRNCPTGAKYFDDAAFLSHRAMLEQNYRERAEPVWFL